MQNLKKYILCFGLLLLLCLFLFLPGINHLPITDQDEAHFAQATKQMIETHNYFLIAFQNTIRYQKPPGINWLQALSNLVLSKAPYTTIWPYRLPSLIGALFSVFITFSLAKKYTNLKTGVYAGIILCTSVLLIVEAHLAVIDACLLATITAQQYALAFFYLQRKPSTAMAVLFWISLSLGVALKGVTLLVAILTILAIIVFSREIRWLKLLNPIPGLVFFIASLLWLPLLKTTGDQSYLWMMLKKDLLPKLHSGVENHGAPPGTFLALSIALFWPMSLHFPRTIRYTWQHRKNHVVFFLLTWLLPTWLFFELMPTKLPQYVLPTFPAIAILVALNICEYTAKNQKIDLIYYGLWTLFSFFLIAAINIGTIYFLHFIPKSLIIISCIYVIGISMSIYYQYKRKFQKSTVTLCITTILLFGTVFQWLLPNVKPLWITKSLVEKITRIQHTENLSQDIPIVSISYHEPSLVFYFNTQQVTYSRSTDFEKTLSPLATSELLLLINKTDLKKLTLKNICLQKKGELSALNQKNPLQKNQIFDIFLVQRNEKTGLDSHGSKTSAVCCYPCIQEALI